LRQFAIAAVGLEPTGGYERGIVRALLAAGLSVCVASKAADAADHLIGPLQPRPWFTLIPTHALMYYLARDWCELPAVGRLSVVANPGSRRPSCGRPRAQLVRRASLARTRLSCRRGPPRIGMAPRAGP
jgi:hypothetical protein